MEGIDLGKPSILSGDALQNDTSSPIGARISPTGGSSITTAAPQKPKRSRRGAPKSRRGCLTCKIRHVKCDETKPACQNCAETNRVCDYLQASSIRLPVLHRLATHTVPPTLRPDYALTTSPTVSVDAQNLDYFLKVCCSDFSGFFVHKIWEQIIPQHTVTEPSVRYAAMAIGAMHRSHAFQKGHSTDSERRRAVVNYTKSLSALNSTISNNQASRDLVCLASLLFMVFEVSRGNGRACLMHLNAGLEIVQSMSQERASSPAGYMYELVSIFSRLDIQAATFAPGHGAKVLTKPIIPPEFFNLIQARETLDAIIALMHYYLEPHGQAYRYHPRLSSQAPATVTHQVDEIKTLLAAWLERFEGFIVSRSLKHTQRDHAAASILRISYLHTSVFLDTFSVFRQRLYDGYLPHFTKIVEHATFVIDLGEKTQIHSGRRQAFDIGTVQPLQFVARKCRNRTLRRRAIELSEKAGREGAWDGQNMAKVLRWVVAKEEENLRPTEEEVALGLAKFGDEVPEEKHRLHGVQVDFDRLGQRVVIRTSRSRDSHNLDEVFEYLEGSFPWCGQQGEKDVEVDLVTGLMG